MLEKADRIHSKTIDYEGDGISLRRLEDSIALERKRQNHQLGELNGIRVRNIELQEALISEMGRLKDLSSELEKSRGGKPNVLKSMFSWLPWVSSPDSTRRSIEELLRGQFEVSSIRLRESTDFSDRLEAAKSDLYDEIERLNERIVRSAKNEELAADYVTELRDLKIDLEFEIAQAIPASAHERELITRLDRTRRLLAEHTTKLKLYSTSEDRIAKLKFATRQLADTIAHLQADITRYVTAASEKLDLIAGQIQAIGAAADAANVILELKHSLDALTESMNLTTRFVAETQVYFKENVDEMIDDLDVYDEETAAALSENLVFNEIVDDLDVENALASALGRQIDALIPLDEQVQTEEGAVVLDFADVEQESKA